MSIRVTGTGKTVDTEHGPRLEVFTPDCFMCGDTGKVLVVPSEWERYVIDDRSLIQHVFVSLTIDQRDQLMTGLHVGACQDNFYSSIGED